MTDPRVEKMTKVLTPFVAPQLLQQAAAAAAAAAGVDPHTIQVQRRCTVMDPRGQSQCIRQSGHVQTHLYGAKPVNQVEHKAPPRGWSREVGFYKKSGLRNYAIRVGDPCKVVGERGLWKVISVEFGRSEQHKGKINVEVTNDSTGHSRIFPSDKIIYKRGPNKKKASA